MFFETKHPADGHCRILDYRYKTWIPLLSFVVTIIGWWAWNFFLSAAYSNTPGSYSVYKAFVEHFGKDLNWWATLVIVVAVLVVFDLIINMTKKRFWPSIVDVWQEIEEDRRSKKLEQED